MGGDSGDESRQTISAAQLLSMGSCSVEEIGHIRLIVAWGNAFPAGTNGLSAMLEKGVELAAALQRQDTVCALQTQCVELGTLMQSAGDDPVDEALVKDIRKQVCEMLGRAGIDPNKSFQQQEDTTLPRPATRPARAKRVRAGRGMWERGILSWIWGVPADLENGTH